MKLKWFLTGLATLAVAVTVAVVAALSSMDFTDLAKAAQDEVERRTGRALTIAGPIDLELSRQPAIVLEDVALANAPWGSGEPLLAVKEFELEVALLPLLLGDIDVKRLVLVEPEIFLEIDAQGRGNWVFGPESVSGAPEAPVEPGGFALPRIERLALRGGGLVFLDGRSGTALRFDLERLNGTLEGSDGRSQLIVAGRYGGTPVEAKATLDAAAALTRGGSSEIEIAAGLGDSLVKLAGSVAGLPAAPRLQATLFAEGPSLAALSAFAAADLPNLGPYALSARLSLEEDRLAFSALTATLGGSDLAGNGSLDLAGPRPRLEGAFVANVLNLEDFQSRTGAAAGAAPATGPDYVFPDAPLPFEPPKGLDAEIKLNASRLRLPSDLVLQEVDLKLKLAEGRLRAAPIEAGLAGGRLAGALEVDTASDLPTVALRLEAERLDYGRLLRSLELESGVEGRLDLALDVRGRGRSPHAVAATADGAFSAVSEEGAVNSHLLETLSIGLGDLLAPLLGARDRTSLHCFAARFDLAGGRATSRVLLLDTPAVTLVGEGALDLGRERLDLIFDSETRQTSLASLAVPFKVTGGFRSPRVEPDPLGAAGNLVEGVGGVAGRITSLAGSLGAALSGGPASGGAAGPCTAALAVARAELPATAAPSSPAAAPATAPQGGAPSKASGGKKSLGDAVDDFTRDLKKLFD